MIVEIKYEPSETVLGIILRKFSPSYKDEVREQFMGSQYDIQGLV